MSESEREYYTWERFDADVKKIADWARNRGFKNIYGIPRGGLIVGVALSHLLDLPLVLSRDDITRQTLIVDDIVETGGTVEHLKMYLGFRTGVASLYDMHGARVQPDFCVNHKIKWIVFPWETDKTSKYDNNIKAS